MFQGLREKDVYVRGLNPWTPCIDKQNVNSMLLQTKSNQRRTDQVCARVCVCVCVCACVCVCVWV